MKNSALIIIDVQNDYFPGGKMALPGAEQAVANLAKVLDAFRTKQWPVILVEHESVAEGSTFFLPGSTGQKTHESVQPVVGETVIVKHFPNSFHHTELLQHLQRLGVEKLVITGMMTFMCVDATTRAATDLGFDCILVHDCTAAPPAEFGGVTCTPEQVQAAFTCALSHICERVVGTDEFLEEFREE
jgi:nicotinamidase-related amidase